ncbi:MAG TPA: toprim domain-containing protein [Burkholderiaceae bacterium]
MAEWHPTLAEVAHAVLGVELPALKPGTFVRFRGAADRAGQKSAYAKLFPDEHGAIFGDWKLGAEGSWSARNQADMTPAERVAYRAAVRAAKEKREREQASEWRRSGDRIRAILRGSRPIVDGDPAALYLRRRVGLDASALPQCLRIAYLPCIEDGIEIGVFPTLIAPLVKGTETVALHRTYLTEQGRKAPVPTVRKLTPAAGILSGCAIPLSAPSGGAIGVAEGIETALAASRLSGLPTVAAYSASNLASYRWPREARRVIVYGDNDPAGLAAAEGLRSRAAAAGVSCQVVIPEKAGQDWCDVLQEGRE